MKLHTILKQHKNISVPWEVWHFISSDAKEIVLAGDQASIGGDFGSLEELRECIGWYANQLGGKVKWED